MTECSVCGSSDFAFHHGSPKSGTCRRCALQDASKRFRANYVGRTFNGCVVVALKGSRRVKASSVQLRRNKGRTVLQQQWLVRCLTCGWETTRMQWALRKKGCFRCKTRALRKPSEDVLWNAVLSVYRAGAAARGLVWALEEAPARAIMLSPCVYCGRRPRRKAVRDFVLMLSGIDRVDNVRGYEPGNVQPCCADCNRAKGVFGPERFAAWIDALVAHRNRES